MSVEVAKAEMLILARESRGLTQAALAEASGVSQGYISKGENEIIPVYGERLDAIARALEYPVEFFAEDEHTLGVDALFHRKLRTTKATDLRRIQAQINISRVQVKRMMRGIAVDAPYPFPRFDVDEVGGPERAAQLVRRAWSLPMGPVGNLVRSIEAAGGVVVPIDIGTDKVSAAAQWPAGDRPYFFVNRSHSGERQRFSLAHEVGHMVLHAFPEDDHEEQADRFASEFLMPEKEIRPQLRGKLTPARLAELKRYWKVSMAAIIKRAEQLRVITAKQMTSLFKLLSARGWRKVEPLPIPPEEPEVLTGIIETHLKSHAYSIEDLSRVSLMSPREFLERYPVPAEDAPLPPPRSHLRAVG